ncbi:MAG TPA: hypothetical protein PLS67_02155 [Accumulibacter sp.]|jgi:hypothetical protein|nr:hypothetical protein [Accumulibacter sp.]HQC79309.1 hypothetical protein [Accumulibacter sp.]
MNAVLDIGRLSTRIRGADPAFAQAVAGRMRRLADRPLAGALEGAGERALRRAGLPADAVVAVRRIDLALRVAADVDEIRLAVGWAGAFESALADLLAGSPPGEREGGGESDENGAPVWFADVWAAESRHLRRRAAGRPDAWWAPDLVAAGEGLAALDPPRILSRWLDRDPARAAVAMVALLRAEARVVALLSPATASLFARRLIDRFTGGEAAPAAVPEKEGKDRGQNTGQRPAHAGRSATAPHAAILACLERRWADWRPAWLAAGRAAQTLPWLAAALFADNPSVSRLPAATVEHALRVWLGDGPAPRQTADAAADAPALTRPTRHLASDRKAGETGDRRNDQTTDEAAVVSHEVRLAGLLLLLRPLGRLPRLPHLGDLALLALRRVLAPLPAGERAVAEERERPLLAVFAPECDWRAPIATVPLVDADAAGAVLDALMAAIPADIAFAPGGERRVFGRTGVPFANAPEQRLARLLLRPGVLRVTAWDAELVWPLAGIDLALRRAGWDQDPGWLPWIGRRLRFRFGDPA